MSEWNTKHTTYPTAPLQRPRSQNQPSPSSLQAGPPVGWWKWRWAKCWQICLSFMIITPASLGEKIEVPRYWGITLCRTKKEENHFCDGKVTSLKTGPDNHIVLLVKGSRFSVPRVDFISKWDWLFLFWEVIWKVSLWKLCLHIYVTFLFLTTSL